MRKLPDLLQVTPSFTTQTNVRGSIDVVRVKAITPILGGGVDSFVPDPYGVRICSIRGALRWWWRAMQSPLDPDELRRQEQLLWGGVGRNAEEKASTSAVRLDVRVVNKSAPEPAGRHERRDGKLRPLATWTGGSDYGYGLFPLQRSNDERKNYTGAGDMPTKDWRRQLEFDLHVHLKEESLRQSFFDALTLWLVFGGYGARTRRGFGALESETHSFDNAMDILRRVQPAHDDKRPTLAHYTVLEGPSGKPDEVHRLLLKCFSMFRQGSNIGRNPGRESNRPGRSRWPEADSLRKLTGKRFTTHPINERLLKAPNAPRAEFGLPIIVQFKDLDDKPAEATIAGSSEGGRFASPVLMRPVRRGNAYVPIVMILHGHRPDAVFVHTKQKSSKVPFVYDDERLGGALDPIRNELQAGGGHAVDAFAHWLETKHGFARILRGQR